MNQWSIVYAKELREMWHNRKWLWIPIVFILLGVMQPVSTHFMPQLLKISSSLPKGTIIHIPTPSAESVIAKAQSQFGTLGLLILVLAFMGITSGERQRGVLELVLVKPVSFCQYVMAKWCAVVTMVVVAIGLGYLSAWYYTEQLIGHVSALHTFTGAFVYALWVILVLTFTMLFSTLLVSQIATAFISLFIAVGLSTVSGLLRWNWSPGYLPNQAAELITSGTSSHLLIDCALWLVFIVSAIIGSSFSLRHNVASTRDA